MTDLNKQLTLVIPVYNGADFILETIQKLCQWRNTQNNQVKIIIVNDGSDDKTGSILNAEADNNGIKVVALPLNRGKGAALRAGFGVATTEFVAFTDADLPYGLSVLNDMLRKMQSDSAIDLLYGSRSDKQSTIKRGYGFLRRVGRLFFSVAVRLLAVPEIPDTQCGLKMFRRRAASLVSTKGIINRFAFDIEAFVVCRDNNFKVVSFPVELTHRAQSSVRLVVDTMRMLGDILRIRVRSFNKGYLL